LSEKVKVSYRNAYTTDKKAFVWEKKDIKTVVRKKELFTFANDYFIRSFLFYQSQFINKSIRLIKCNFNVRVH